MFENKIINNVIKIIYVIKTMFENKIINNK